jgi:hypothetical protein
VTGGPPGGRGVRGPDFFLRKSLRTYLRILKPDCRPPGPIGTILASGETLWRVERAPSSKKECRFAAGLSSRAPRQGPQVRPQKEPRAGARPSGFFISAFTAMRYALCAAAAAVCRRLFSFQCHRAARCAKIQITSVEPPGRVAAAGPALTPRAGMGGVFLRRRFGWKQASRFTATKQNTTCTYREEVALDGVYHRDRRMREYKQSMELEI